MEYQVSLKGIGRKKIYPLGEDFRGTSKDGGELSFTNYYMQKDGAPFFGISGEFHYSRMPDFRWEDELIKMKMCGINIVSTYLFWIHHEEEEGSFDFSGRRDLRRFVRLCAAHGLYVILRVGPFAHGEVRNGGLPDWLYGKPFEVRKSNDGFLYHTRRFYEKVAEEVSGLFYQDNGPVIGVQIDNEYMHSSAPWEITTGISNEWVSTGDEGDAYMLRLKELAAECGLLPVFYTCTAWGGAATPDSMMPLWGGYAFRPWIFYSYKGEHPATEEYVYQDFHKNGVACTNDFQPFYRPEDRPYACSEMGGGMMCCYYYRFRYPYKSVDAMANIKMASGCNFLGYYMFQGGSNPLGKHGGFMNEGQVPKISYDYQAALGEFGQVRESYRRLKSIHYFTAAFADRLCALQTVLPEGASRIDPKDTETLRYAVRTDETRGFLFVNNYQDHFSLPDRRNERVTLQLEGEALTWHLDIDADENAILPFHLDMDGIDLIQANAQLITRTSYAGEVTYVFFVPDGMRGEFVFEQGVQIAGQENNTWQCAETFEAECFIVEKEKVSRKILVLSRRLANAMFLLRDGRLLFTDGALLEDDRGIRLEHTEPASRLHVYPAEGLEGMKHIERMEDSELDFFGTCQVTTKKKEAEVTVEQTGPSRYTLHIPGNALDGVKDLLLQIDYVGDIGNAFINGRLISDNFANGAVWEIGLKEFREELQREGITLYIVPLKEGVNVKVESAMAARSEEAEAYIAELKSVRLKPVYEVEIG